MTNKIATLEKELAIRQSAAKHLTGTPARQNSNRIEQLYDLLCNAHIESFEARA